jgi:hypothetical protein
LFLSCPISGCHGVIESTGMTVQARNSYIPSEFQWQHKFKPMLATITSSGVCEFDLNFFHETEEVPLIGITYAPYKKLRRVDIKHSPHRKPNQIIN